MTPEGKVKASVKKHFKEVGIWHYMPVQNGMGVVGIPDIIGCAPIIVTEDMVGQTVGLFFAVETKAPGKIANTTANQKNILNAIATHGGIALVADSVELVKDVTEKLYGLDRQGE